MEGTWDDVRELKRFLAMGSSPFVENILKREIQALEGSLPKEQTEKPVEKQPNETVVDKRKYEPIASYAFVDNKTTAQFIVDSIRGLENAQIEFKPEDHAFTISVLREAQNLPNLKLTVSPLHKKIIPADCKYSVKREKLTITLAKKKEATWMKPKKSPLAPGKKKEEKDKAKENPNAALMDMMKKMYDEGDDEMKRTISKAMWEAQHKKEEDKKDE